MYEEVQCIKCKQMHPSFHYSGSIYYSCGKEHISEYVSNYVQRIARGDIE